MECRRRRGSDSGISSAKNKNHFSGEMVFSVDLIGFEPTTPTMRMWCAPNCATSPLRCSFDYPIIAPHRADVKISMGKNEEICYSSAHG